MERGFGIDATVPSPVAGEVAARAEELGYQSFWVNGSPPIAALDSIAAAAQNSSLRLGIGVLPLTAIPVEGIVAEVLGRDLPQQRLSLGLGSARVPGALAEVRNAVEVIRSELSVEVVAAAVGPKMTEQAGEIGDAVLFTWWPAKEVVSSRRLVEVGAARANRPAPPILSYIRCALLPDAADAVTEKAARYAAIPRYAAVFARSGLSAAETVVTGASAAELAPGIEREESVLDASIVRAVTAEDTAASLAPLLEACAPRVG